MGNNNEEIKERFTEKRNNYVQRAPIIARRSAYVKATDYWFEVFERILPKSPEQLYFSKENDKANLWLFSDQYILVVSDFLHGSSIEKDSIIIYPLSQIVGHIDMEIEYYYLNQSSYDDKSKITIRFMVKNTDKQVVIEATGSNCPQLVDVAKYLLTHIG